MSDKAALKLLPQVQPASFLHQQFQELKCYQQVIAHMKQGFSFEYIRALIQDKSKEWVEIPAHQVLDRVGKLHSELSTIDLVAPFLPGYVEAAAEEIENGLNEAAEMRELYEMQKARILLALEMEKKMKGVLNTNLSREVRLAKELLESSQDIKAKAGLVSGKPGKQLPMSGFTAQPGKHPTLTPKSLNKILGAVQALTEKAVKGDKK